MSPTNYPSALDTTTQLPNDQTDGTLLNRAGVDHAGEHVNLSDAVRAIEAELGLDPSGASATVRARLDAIGGGGGDVFLGLANTFTAFPQTIGSGDAIDVSGAVAGNRAWIKEGTAGSPVTGIGSSLRVSRTEAVTQATYDAHPGFAAGGQNLQYGAISASVKGTAASELQIAAVTGYARNAGTGAKSDACALIGVARMIDTGATGTGIGGYMEARKTVTSVEGITGLEVQAQNQTGTPDANDDTGMGNSRGLLVTAGGTANSQSAAGIKFGHPTGWAKFDVGIHAASNDGGSIVNALIRDNSQAAVSYDIAGTHATAALRVASGSGSVLIGTTTLTESSALLEVKPTGTAAPLVRLGGPAGSYTLKLTNTTANANLGISGGAGALMTGSVAGDGVLYAGASNKFLLGRTTGADIMFGGGVGFNGTSPVAQSTGWSVSNVTTDKVLDANATSIDELADVLGTLITYLLSRGDIAA